MKNILLLLSCLFSMAALSQGQYNYKSGGRIFDQQGQRLTSKDLREQFKGNERFLELYNSGRIKKSVGNVLLYGGLATFVGKFISATTKNTVYVGDNGNVTVRRTDNILFYVGGAMVISAIPIKVGFSKKIRKSVDVLNEDASQPASILTQEVVFNQDGIGVRVKF